MNKTRVLCNQMAASLNLKPIEQNGKFAFNQWQLNGEHFWVMNRTPATSLWLLSKNTARHQKPSHKFFFYNIIILEVTNLLACTMQLQFFFLNNAQI